VLESKGEILRCPQAAISKLNMRGSITQLKNNGSMLRHGLLASIVVALAGALLGGCGSSFSTQAPGKGTLFTFVGDVPFCDILSFRVLATGSSTSTMFLRIADTTDNVSVIPSTAAIKINFGALRDFSTIFNSASIRAATYDQATVVFSGPSLVVYDPTQNPPIRTISVTLPKSPPAVPIHPNLIVNPPVNTKTQVSALQIDFDLRHSVQLDAKGQLTGVINPVMTATPLSASPNQGFGEIDDMLGIVQRVDTSTTNAKFIGDFGLATLEGTIGSLTVNLTSDTVINGVINCGPPTAASQTCGSALLGQILTDSFAEVDGYVDTDGNFIANSVEIEDAENPDTTVNQFAFLGNVLSVNRDPNGNVAHFTFYIRDEEPSSTVPSVPLDTVVQVNPSPSTIYQFSSRSTDFANLAFDQTSVTPGQELVVHGVFTKPPSSTTSTVAPLTLISPDKIYLKLQTHQGTFSSLVQTASDNKTGAFTLAPCCTLFNNAPILVITNTNTAFLDVDGLNALTPQTNLLVKGLLFYDLNGGVLQGNTINDVTVAPGTLVLLAKQVHKLS
jgi:hypothetical protein